MVLENLVIEASPVPFSNGARQGSPNDGQQSVVSDVVPIWQKYDVGHNGCCSLHWMNPPFMYGAGWPAAHGFLNIT